MSDLFVTNTPHFNNGCNHSQHEYVGTIEFFTEEHEIKFIDVYVFKGVLGDEVCIRYGNKDPEYYSPTDLFTFLSVACGNCLIREYKEALTVLRAKGKLSFVRK